MLIFLANHDNARMVSRYGNDTPKFRTVSAQLINTFLLSMRGTPYTYYGDELGMTNIDMPDIEQYVDVAAKGDYQRAVAAGADLDAFMKELNYYSRENGRTPMQWNDTKNAGFTEGTPWKRVNENYRELNVAAQEEDPNSVLNHFRKMTKLRKENELLVYGKYTLIQPEHQSVYAYTREWEGQKWLILLNFSETRSDFEYEIGSSIANVMINNYDEVAISGNTLDLKPYQAVIFKLDGSPRP